MIFQAPKSLKNGPSFGTHCLILREYAQYYRPGEIGKKLDSKLGCEFLYTFWDILYTGVFGYAESNSQVRFLIFCLLDLFFRGQTPSVGYKGQISFLSHFHILVLQKMVVLHIKLFSRKMRFRKSLFWQLPVLICRHKAEKNLVG